MLNMTDCRESLKENHHCQSDQNPESSRYRQFMNDFFRGILADHVNGMLSNSFGSYLLKIRKFVDPISKSCFETRSNSSEGYAGDDIQGEVSMEEKITNEEELESLPLVQKDGVVRIASSSLTTLSSVLVVAITSFYSIFGQQ